MFSPGAINTFRTGVSRATFDYDSSSQAFPRIFRSLREAGLAESSSAVVRQQPGLPPSRRRVRTTHRTCAATEVIHLHGSVQMTVGATAERRRLVSAVRNNDDTVSSTLGLANFANMQSFLPGHTQQFHMSPPAARN